MKTWINGENGNRASLEKWGSEDAARASLKTLKGCSDCSDCSECSRCSCCSECSKCSKCSRLRFVENKKGDEGAPSQLLEIVIPKIEQINQKVYAAVSQPDALKMDSWHTCETAHCRAGWVVTLAGEQGNALEARFNTELAAMLIYRESGSPINPSRFYDSNEDTLTDMQRMAEIEINVETK